jgi:hypothetical protein
MRYYIYLVDEMNELIDIKPLCDDFNEIDGDVKFEFFEDLLVSGWGILDVERNVMVTSKFKDSDDMFGDNRIGKILDFFETESLSIKPPGIINYIGRMEQAL